MRHLINIAGKLQRAAEAISQIADMEQTIAGENDFKIQAQALSHLIQEKCKPFLISTDSQADTATTNQPRNSLTSPLFVSLDSQFRIYTTKQDAYTLYRLYQICFYNKDAPKSDQERALGRSPLQRPISDIGDTFTRMRTDIIDQNGIYKLPMPCHQEEIQIIIENLETYLDYTKPLHEDGAANTFDLILSLELKDSRYEFDESCSWPCFCFC